MNSSKLGYSFLSPEEQIVYEMFEEAMRNHASSCDASRIKHKVDYIKVLLAVLGDNPDIIYFNKTMLRAKYALFSRQVDFVGCMSHRTAMEYEKRLHEAVENAAWEIDRTAKNDREILLGISEYLQKNVAYDYDEMNSVIRGKSKSPTTHNAYGALCEHKAVCDGFASAFSIIAQYFGMNCLIVNGRSSFQKAAKVEHSWAIVDFQGKYYHIDPTWDTNTYSVMNAYSYIYFGLSDDEILLDHDWDYKLTPKCDSNELSFFKYNGFIAYSEDQISEILSRQLRNNAKILYAKLAPIVVISGDSEEYIVKRIKKAMEKNNVYTQFKYNWEDNNNCLMVVLNP